MKFNWKLFPLQRKLEWDLDLAQGRLAFMQRGSEHAAGVLQALEGTRADQSAAALAATQRRTDPVAHGQALAYLAGMEAQLARARKQRAKMEDEVAVARAECMRCSQRLEALDTLHDQAFTQFTCEVQRAEAKEADFAWLARSVGVRPE
jgi:flagellar export protein FliJ